MLFPDSTALTEHVIADKLVKFVFKHSDPAYQIFVFYDEIVIEFPDKSKVMLLPD